MKCSRVPTDDVFGNLLSIRINYSICSSLPTTRSLVGEHIFPNLILIFKHSKKAKTEKHRQETKTALQQALISNS